ncbi:PTS system mannose/fructose/N-acetylgalactosamine-transporter subunit IIB [Xylocopilactobacillus apis]|uniref:PTS system mannose/fructose/N-acetylgalactosamine-transporter subunit IIB n=1 Tax=Xylocopilactobacillus apis TaxID=2932183 RepID=A0AAU9DPJ7_9LACO|nr:PTS sugar transporter subunit IIB [Xylocopilactobacillus apis]BDR56963.1 PTS system mannose/fructose/N-acetylgalactosamine-transporter subunit IIB [Xylocopilactobacillus apis]
MIAQLRIDDRLIHGQVALVWTKELNTPGIVVANDNAANNETVKMTLKMATPTGKKLLIRTVDDAIKVFNNPKGKDMRMFALTNNVKDALKIARNVEDIDGINVANVGRFAENADQSVQLSSTLMLDKEELTALKELVKLSIPVFNQVVPSNNKTEISSLLKNVE